jgi:hypothetical protein
MKKPIPKGNDGTETVTGALSAGARQAGGLRTASAVVANRKVPRSLTLD